MLVQVMEVLSMTKTGFMDYCHGTFYLGGRGGSDLALFPTAVMPTVNELKYCICDYPQYFPGIRKEAVDNNFTGWMLLSIKKCRGILHSRRDSML